MSKSADHRAALFDAAKSAMAFCHAPYSKFPVGAAILAGNGEIYKGANIEVISFPEGWCAETTAIGHMVMAGEKEIVEVAVIAEKLDQCTPCGGCRQRLAEFGNADTQIHLCDQNGVVKTVRLGDLLPLSFATDVIA
jgi:cytidine deaminase